MKTKDLVTAGIALLGLIVSMVTFYLTQLKRAKLSVSIGPNVQFFYTPGGELRFFLPATFTNSGPQSGIVFKCAVVISRADNPEQNYYLEWHQFHLFDKSKGRWDFDDMASPLAVDAKSTERRYILFRWPLERGSLVLREGLYCLRFFMWAAEKPRYSVKLQRQFSVDSRATESLERHRAAKEPHHVEIILNKATDSARVMTKSEVEQLLEKT